MKPCCSRVAMPREGVNFCRLPLVHAPGNLVSDRQCHSCPLANQPCDAARPSPEINPSLLQRLANFGKAGAVHLASGLAEATPKVQAERQAACLACPFWSAQLARCQHAGCGCTAMATKWRWASSVCPDESADRWKTKKPPA